MGPMEESKKGEVEKIGRTRDFCQLNDSSVENYPPSPLCKMGLEGCLNLSLPQLGTQACKVLSALNSH